MHPNNACTQTGEIKAHSPEKGVVIEGSAPAKVTRFSPAGEAGVRPPIDKNIGGLKRQ
jgi:DUF971 family protein